MEDRRILAVFQDDDEVRITVPAVPRAPRSAALLFGALGRAGVSPRLAEQRPGGTGPGAAHYELALIVARHEGPRAVAALEHARGAVGCGAARCEAGVGRLALLGADLRGRAEVTARLLAALDEAGVRFEFVSAAADRVSLVIRVGAAAQALDAVRDGFGPGVDQVYFAETPVIGRSTSTRPEPTETQTPPTETARAQVIQTQAVQTQTAETQPAVVEASASTTAASASAPVVSGAAGAGLSAPRPRPDRPAA